MIKKIVISLTSAFIVLFTTNCAQQASAPGDTGVEMRTTETDKKPGNIMAEGRIETTGE